MNSNEEIFHRLMVKSQKGDKKSYTELLQMVEKWLARYFSRRIAYSAQEDLVQVTLLSIHRTRASYNPDRPFLPWLATIARYKWIDQLRKDNRADHVEFDEEHISQENPASFEAQIDLPRLLKLLPSKQSQAIRLTKITGYSVKEVSRMTGQSESSVKVNVHRGIKKCQLWLNRNYDGERL